MPQLNSQLYRHSQQLPAILTPTRHSLLAPYRHPHPVPPQALRTLRRLHHDGHQTLPQVRRNGEEGLEVAVEKRTAIKRWRAMSDWDFALSDAHISECDSLVWGEEEGREVRMVAHGVQRRPFTEPYGVER